MGTGVVCTMSWQQWLIFGEFFLPPYFSFFTALLRLIDAMFTLLLLLNT